jgi:coenzyme F420-reducing hydrogenase alpha subunit
MSAVQALESIFGTTLDKDMYTLRRIMYCGEWLESHALHVHLLAAPDFLGFNDAIAMAERYPQEVKRGLKLQALGNKLIKLLGGRSVHPVGVRVGGFHRIPTQQECDAMLQELRDAVADAERLVKWVASLDFPDDGQTFTSVALHHADEYPMNKGRIVSSQGLDIDIGDYAQHFEEFQVPHSTAFHSALQGQPYLVGPLARVNLNWDQLHDSVKKCVAQTPVRFPSDDMFHSIVARCVEIQYALVEAIRLLENLDLTNIRRGPGKIQPRAGTGYGCTEAPRGILWHRYELDERGHVKKATIVPPTSQNQARIEQDIAQSLTRFGLEQDEEALKLRAETVIRNYDPCISCSTHFLDLTVRRKPS